jgi:hypothetical protein
MYPAAIDRRGLVGVGELATPRWAQSEKSGIEETLDDEGEDYEVVLTDDMETDGPHHLTHIRHRPRCPCISFPHAGLRPPTRTLTLGLRPAIPPIIGRRRSLPVIHAPSPGEGKAALGRCEDTTPEQSRVILRRAKGPVRESNLLALKSE